MSKLLAFAAALALSGCAGTTVYEAALGVNTSRSMPWSQGQDGGFSGGRDTVRFTVERESLDGRHFCGVTHISHLSHGWPVNDQPEDWLDMFECGVRMRSGR